MEAFDIVIVADMSRAGDIGLRIAQDMLTNATLGYRTGLVHAGATGSSVRIHPEILRRVREQKAEVISPDWEVRAKVLVVYLPTTRMPAFLKMVAADQALLVLDKLPEFDLEKAYEESADLFGVVSLAGTNSWLCSHLASRYPSLPMKPFEWRPSGHSDLPANGTKDEPRICVIATKEEHEGEQRTAFGTLADLPFEMFLLDCSEAQGVPKQENLPQIRLGDLAFERLMRCTDIVVYFPPPVQSHHPDATIASALTQRKTVVLARHLQSHYGAGAVYCHPGEMAATVQGLLDRYVSSTADNEQFLTDYTRRIRSLIGIAPERPQAISRLERKGAASVLFFTGSQEHGEMMRLLAIARRIERSCQPVFVSTDPTADIVESFGYVAEYIAPRLDTLSPLGAWSDWFRVELEQLMDFYNVRLVVTGEQAICKSLAQYIAPRGDYRFVLVQSDVAPETAAASACSPFDLVLKLDDLGEAERPSRSCGHAPCLRVPPVTLLEQEEALSRQNAALALGLDHSRSALLVRLGAELKQTTAAVRLAEQLNELTEAQIVVLDETADPVGLLWPPQATRIEAYDIARYLHAFDASVASADYDAFHDAISHGLPTIFVGNTKNDLWERRVRYAESAGAALGIPADKIDSVVAMIRILLSREANEFMRSNCRRLYRGNGAGEAAEALRELVS
jgi:hypothetical protein